MERQVHKDVAGNMELANFLYMCMTFIGLNVTAQLTDIELLSEV